LSAEPAIPKLFFSLPLVTVFFAKISPYPTNADRLGKKSLQEGKVQSVNTEPLFPWLSTPDYKLLLVISHFAGSRKPEEDSNKSPESADLATPCENK
jgi:hypothetical protein